MISNPFLIKYFVLVLYTTPVDIYEDDVRVFEYEMPSRYVCEEAAKLAEEHMLAKGYYVNLVECYAE